MQHSVAGDSRTLLQVEINTIASSFASLSTRIYEMYRDLDPQCVGNLPVNEALQNIAEVLAVAHNEFSNQRKSWAVEDKVALHSFILSDSYACICLFMFLLSRGQSLCSWSSKAVSATSPISDCSNSSCYRSTESR